MARKPETNFRARVKRDLATLRETVVFPIQQQTILGDPDLICCIRGKFVALELKSAKGKASVLQTHKLESVRKAGGVAFTVFPSLWEEIFASLNILAGGSYESSS